MKLRLFWSVCVWGVCISLNVHARSLNVIVDPGHGGSDTGATRGSLRESEIVLNISKNLLQLLNSNEKFKASSTRDTDQMVSLESRTLTAEKNRADLFVSIHANSSPVASAKGVEIYFQNQMPPDEESLYLANRENEGRTVQQVSTKPKGDLAAILDDLHRQNQIYMSFNLARDVHAIWTRKDHTKIHIRQAPFHVLSEVKIPSILVETGFLTNAMDSQRLAKADYQKEIAQILYEGLLIYRERWLLEQERYKTSAYAH
jgi:N-acetylmuramoyl-L-alanine amidase